MFKNRCKLVAMVLLISLVLTGCWDAADVNSLNLSTMVILDRKGDEVSFTLEIAKILPASRSGEGDGGKNQTYLTGSGKNLAEARQAVDMQMDKPLFLGTIRALIITERAAANDLAEYLFRLRENQEYRQKVNISIIRDEPQALIEAKSESDQPIGFAIDDTIHTGQEDGQTCADTTERYVDDILAKRGFIIHHIGLTDKQQIKLDGYSVFRDAKLVGFIPMESSRGLSYLLSDHQPLWVYRLPGDTGSVTMEVGLGHRKIKPSYQDGRIRFQVRLAFNATIQYKSDVSLFPLNKQNLQQYSDDLNQMLAQEITATIEQSQDQFQSDYLNFDEIFRLAYPDEFEQMDWSAEYPKAEIEVGTSVKISVSDKIDIEAS